ncbi:Yqey-like protein [compost metagenome]
MSNIEINPIPSIFDQIKAEFLQARKDRNEFAVKAFSTFIGDLETKAKSGRKEAEINDINVIAAIKNALSKLEELKKLLSDPVKIGEVDLEKSLFLKYLPAQLSPMEIQVIIENSGLDNLGKIQGLFKQHYAGKYDAAEVTRASKKLLGLN